MFTSRPEGEPSAGNFEIVDTDVPPVGEGQMLRRTIWLSVDPYMRGRMSTAKSYAAPAKIGEPMVGGTVSQVVESKDPRFAAGDFVASYDGWQQYAVGDGTETLTGGWPETTTLKRYDEKGSAAYYGQ